MPNKICVTSKVVVYEHFLQSGLCSSQLNQRVKRLTSLTIVMKNGDNAALGTAPPLPPPHTHTHAMWPWQISTVTRCLSSPSHQHMIIIILSVKYIPLITSLVAWAKKGNTVTNRKQISSAVRSCKWRRMLLAATPKHNVHSRLSAPKINKQQRKGRAETLQNGAKQGPLGSTALSPL